MNVRRNGNTRLAAGATANIARDTNGYVRFLGRPADDYRVHRQAAIIHEITNQVIVGD